MPRSSVCYIRSVIFLVLFYVNVTAHMIAALPTFILPRRILHVFVRSYALTSLWLLRVICGTKVEWRGVEKLPKGACILACKHQSAWETFALYAVIDDPTYMYYSTFHWQHLVNGYGGFFPPWYRRFTESMDQFPGVQAMQAIKEHGARYVAIHSERMRGNTYARLVDELERRTDLPLVSRQPAEREGQHGEISVYRVSYADTK